LINILNLILPIIYLAFIFRLLFLFNQLHKQRKIANYSENSIVLYLLCINSPNTYEEVIRNVICVSQGKMIICPRPDSSLEPNLAYRRDGGGH